MRSRARIFLFHFTEFRLGWCTILWGLGSMETRSEGLLIAFTVFGPCVGKPDYSFPVRQPRRVFFGQVE